MGFTQEGLGVDEEMKLHMIKFGLKKLKTPQRRVKYYEPGDKSKPDESSLKSYTQALCQRFCLTYSIVFNADNQLFDEHLENTKFFSSKQIHEFGDQQIEKLISQNELFQTRFEEKPSESTAEKFLDNAFKLSSIDDTSRCLDNAFQCFDFALNYEIFPELTLKYMLRSLRVVANRCYIDISSYCPNDMPKRTNAKVNNNRTFCEKIIRSISRHNSKYNFRNLDFSGLDLRRCYLFNRRGGHDINNLRKADFSGANIAYTVLSGIDMTGACFDDLQCSKNAWIICHNTILENASFKNANLIGVNKTFDNSDGSEFVGSADGYEEESHIIPFLKISTAKNAQLDRDFKEYFEANSIDF